MKITYDPDVDAFYFQVQDKPVAKTLNPSEYCFIDLNKKGEVVGVEILFASQFKINPQQKNLKIENLLLANS
jgi:uncharacterized protein YuzE